MADHLLRTLFVLTALAAPLPCAALQGPVGEPGSVRWFDLLTEDATAASAFYADLFGWDVQRRSEGRYVVRHDGELIAGINEIDPTRSEVTEATWLVGVVVEDVEASVATVRRLDGSVLRDVSTAEGFARWAAVEDPQGGQLLLLEPIRVRNLGGPAGPGHLLWTELWTTDVEAASHFYTEVIGWERGDRVHPDGEYALFESAGEPRAGLVLIENDEIRTGWAPYIGVESLRVTLARVLELGGEVLLEPSSEIYDGLVAIAADPTGVGFLIYQFPEGER